MSLYLWIKIDSRARLNQIKYSIVMIKSLAVCREEKIDKKIYEMQIKMRIGDDLTESKYFAKKT
mgnify:FL=1